MDGQALWRNHSPIALVRKRTARKWTSSYGPHKQDDPKRQAEADKCGPLNTCGDIASPGACRSSCTTDASVSSCPGAGVFLPWELADGVELTPQMALRVQGDVLGTIALALASRQPISSRSHASSRGESSSRSWRTNAARPAAFRCSIPAGSYRRQRSRSSWRSWSRKPAAPTFADLI